MAEESTPATGTAKAASPRSAPAAGGSSPEEELKKHKEAMEKIQQDMNTLKQQMDDRKSKVDVLEKALATTNQVTAAFAGAVQGISAERLEIQDFLSNELPQIEKHEEVKNKKAEIEAIIKQANTKIETKESERLTLEQKAKDEQTALQSKNEEFASKKAEQDALQNLQRGIQDKFNLLRKINQRIKGEGANKPLVKYVLALELKSVWEETKPLFVPTEQLRTTFFAKTEEVRNATSAVAAQEEKTKLAQTAHETARKDVDASKAGRLDDIVKQVGALSTSAPAGAGAGAAAAARAF
jgi:hypothetical protein